MSIRVAIVEDNRALREGLAYLLGTTPGFQCVGTYRQCVDLDVQLRSAPPDVVLMDIGLPGMSGIEGARLVKTHCPTVAVLMLTVYEDEQKIFDAILAGADGYLLKKTPPEKILEAVGEAHAGGAPMTALVARKVLHLFKEHAPVPAEEVQLSEREREVLAGLVKGWSYQKIADHHCISLDTVRSHVKHIYEKLHVHSKAEAVAKALRGRLL